MGGKLGALVASEENQEEHQLDEEMGNTMGCSGWPKDRGGDGLTIGVGEEWRRLRGGTVAER